MGSIIESNQLIEIFPNFLIVGGAKPKNSMLLEANVPNCMLYKEGDTLHVIDTGVTLPFRQILMEGVHRLVPFTKLIIHNSHYHSDHTSNNSIINEIKAKEKKLYMNKITFDRLNCIPFFLNEWQEMSKNFYMLEGLNVDQDLVVRYLESRDVKIDLQKVEQLFSLLNDISAIKVFNRIVPYFLATYAGDTVKTFEPAAEQAHFYDDLSLEVIKIGRTEWRGWNFSKGIQILQVGGHSPGGLVYYFLKIKLFFLGDESTPIPIWSDMNMDRALESFHKYQQMAEDDKVDFMVTGHVGKIFKGKEEIAGFVRGLIHTYEVFSGNINEALTQSKEGLTIDQIYSIIKQKSVPELQSLFNFQFPILGPFVKGHIFNELRNKSYPYEGIGINRRYFSY